ncbi:hypothetical protein [Mycobacterium sp. MS1601]|uniref:hypothetical protein n=1 Tax=Mycobacterium sp. MS1601 TaxID=1936029 RepID=UPI0009F9D94D|nr:hypothetical protein [Mycobacterium sp. MS1601]
MGFEELSADQLIHWLSSWIGKVSGTAGFTAQGSAEQTGSLTVSVHGDLQRVHLKPSAAGIRPELLSRAIEQGYVETYREALRQVGLIFDRVESHAAGSGVGGTYQASSW